MLFWRDLNHRLLSAYREPDPNFCNAIQPIIKSDSEHQWTISSATNSIRDTTSPRPNRQRGPDQPLSHEINHYTKGEREMSFIALHSNPIFLLSLTTTTTTIILPILQTPSSPPSVSNP